MPIDRCENKFSDLATTVLPKLVDEMRAAMQNSVSLKVFCERGRGVKTIARQHFGRNGDFSGCYVLLQDAKPFYVGISRGVIARLRQHGTGVCHFNATLAYRMACDKAPHEMSRAAAMKHADFRRLFEEAKHQLVRSSVALIEINNDMELYLCEAYCAMELDTCQWNTFRTH